MNRAFSIAAAVFGVAIFGLVSWQAGPAEIVRSLAGMGWLALLIPLPQGIAYVFDTIGWQVVFARREGTPSLWRLYWARMAGEAVNLLTPSAYVGGEPLKAYIVARRSSVPGTVAAASVVVAKTLMTLAEVIFLGAGALCALGRVPRGSGLYLGVIATLFAGAGITALLLWAERRGLFMGILRFFRRLGLHVKALESRAEKLERLDQELDRFYREEPRAFFASVAWHFAGWVLGAGEVYMGGRLLGAPIGVLDAIAIEAFSAAAKGATFFAPGSIGFQETAFVLLFKLFGLPAGAGVGYGLVRRARELFFGALGLAWFVRDEWRPLPSARASLCARSLSCEKVTTEAGGGAGGTP